MAFAIQHRTIYNLVVKRGYPVLVPADDQVAFAHGLAALRADARVGPDAELVGERFRAAGFFIERFLLDRIAALVFDLVKLLAVLAVNREA